MGLIVALLNQIIILNFQNLHEEGYLMRLLSIAFVASWLAQSVAAEIPNKYLSVGLLSVVCQNDAKNADEDFYVFSKEGDGWISIVGNVTNIHETAEGFTLKLSDSPHETRFLK